MPASTLAGSRIRARRLDLGIKQSALAQACEISPSYLNLIEHNRRRIGGKLLSAIARALSVDPAVLSAGAERSIVSALHAAAGARPGAAAETDRAEELASRFPGWSALVTEQAERIARLERTVETLSDRLTHDPFLSASLHDVLSTVTAIRSTSAILAEAGDVPADWEARFHRNMMEDSQRLAETSQALVDYLDAGGDAAREIVAPQDELEAWLTERGFHIVELERALAPPIEAIIAEAAPLTTSSARAMAGRFLERYRVDARRVPLGPLKDTVGQDVPDPAALAARFGVDLGTIFRRLASLPEDSLAQVFGLVLCDGAGAFTLRKSIDGFPIPRFGAACPLWPLYQALSRPMAPVRALVSQPGAPERRFLTYAIAQPAQAMGFDAPPVHEAAMLIVPSDAAASQPQVVHPIGTSCRICPREGCRARREPSILIATAV